MGIKNLFTLLEGIIRPGNIKDFAGKTVGIDGYAWLHKSAYQLGHSLVVQNDKSGIYSRLASRITALSELNIRAVLVFDGDKLPSKGKTEDNREELRKIKRELANAFLLEGDQVNANKKFSESYDITPQLAYECYQYLKARFNSLECKSQI
jgi:exonuclease 1